MNEGTKAVVTVSGMARMAGLSGARFYQLQKAGVFPPPERDAGTGKPFYTEALQKACLEVRRRNRGANGEPILFYARRVPLTPPTSKPREKKTTAPEAEQHPELIEALQAPGLAGVTAARAGAAVEEAYPQGTAGVDQAEVVRAAFLHLRRRDPSGNVGRQV